MLRGTHLTREELRTLLNGVRNPLWRLMLVVMYNHGLRVSEATSLTVESIRSGYLVVHRLKGSESTVQKWVRGEGEHAWLDETEGLQKLAKERKPGEPLFPITRSGAFKLMRRTGKREGIPVHKCHPHVLKHSVARHTIGHAGVENVRVHLGHKSLASTGYYLKVTDEEAGIAIRSALLQVGVGNQRA